AVDEVHNHHNFAWREEHQGRRYWVIRKGCTPARPGQRGFVGGSMGGSSVILQGGESSEAPGSPFSTGHRPGRAMGRPPAAGRGAGYAGASGGHAPRVTVTACSTSRAWVRRTRHPSGVCARTIPTPA